MPHRTRKHEALRASGAAAIGGVIAGAAVEASGYAALGALMSGASVARPIGVAIGALAGLAVYGLTRLVDD